MGQEGQETKLYTLAEVKIHNGQDDPRVWIIYKDSVYDVTDYLEEVRRVPKWYTRSSLFGFSRLYFGCGFLVIVVIMELYSSVLGGDYRHPGGGDLITEFAGLDATKAFDDFGHSSDAKKQLKSFKIGEIVEDERRGKAKKKAETKTGGVTVQDSPPGKPQTRSCISIITCGLCG